MRTHPPRTVPGRSLGTLAMKLLAAAVVLAVLLVARPAAAQGTDRALSDPVTSRELMIYAKRLGLSRQQLDALESMHDDYKRDFRVLRDGEIASFMRQLSSVSGGMPRRDVVKELFENITQLEARIGSLDGRLFDRLQPLLTDEQAAMLPRVRLLRERTRYRSQQMMWPTGSPPADLSDIFFETDLPADVFVTIDPMVATYERRVTAELRKLNRATSRMYLDIFDRLAEMGFGDLSEASLTEDPEEMQRMMEAMQAIWAEVTEKTKKITDAIAALNRSTFRSIDVLLPEETSRPFRRRYYARSYPELRWILSADDRAWLEDVDEVEGLTDEMRDAVAAAVADHEQRMDRLLEQTIALLEKQRNAQFSPFDFDQEKMEELQRELSKLQVEAAERHAGIVKTLSEMIGGDAIARLQAARAEPDGPVALSSAGAGAEAEEEAAWSGDQFLPARVSRRELRRYTKRLGLDEQNAIVLEELHHDYVERFQALEAIEAVKIANAAFWGYDAETGVVSPPEAATITELYRLRHRAFDAIRALEDAFFADIGLIAGDGKASLVDRLRRHRLRRTRHLTAHGYYGVGQAAAGRIDLVDVAAGHAFERADAERIDPILDRYERAADELFAALHRTQLALQEVSDRWNAEQTLARQNGASPIDSALSYRDALGKPTRDLEASLQKIAELHERALGEMIETLDAPAGRAFRFAYYRTAYPQVYEDAASVDRPLTEALALDDLTGDQREKLGELAAMYRPEYERVSRAMVALAARGGLSPMTVESDDLREYQSRSAQREKLRFDRNELNFRANGRLRSILTEAQLLRIGGLPSPEDLDGTRHF